MQRTAHIGEMKLDDERRRGAREPGTSGLPGTKVGILSMLQIDWLLQPTMRRLLAVLLACAFLATGTAAPLAPDARREIDALLSRLAASGCEFNRNGTWHVAADARAHLQQKLQYLEVRGTVETTEQFIELAASGSTMTGRPYLVRCGNGAAQESATWLRSQLQLLRK
jgi:hypothetical protein